MTQNKKAFGIAHFLAPESTVYYESVTHELQAGRVADLLLCLTRGTKVVPAHFRAVVTLLLSEACQSQVDPATAVVATDPILLEFGSDTDYVFVGISFVADPRMSTEFSDSIARIHAGDIQDELELKLHHATRLADRISFKFHEDTRKVEWVAGFKKNSEGTLHPPVPVEYLPFSGALDAVPITADYRELGDVQYDDVTVAGEGFVSPLPALTAEILSAVKPPGSDTLAKALAEGDAPVIVAELKKDLSDEEMQKLAGEFMAQLEGNTLVSGAATEEDFKKLVKGGKLSDQELLQLIKGSMPEAELARLIRGAMTPQEIARLISNTLPKEEFAKLLIDGCSAKVIANMLVGEFPMEELMRIIGEGLPASDLAALVQETDQERYREKVEKAAFLVNMGVTPKDRPVISLEPVRPHFSDSDIATILESTDNPEKVIQVLSQVVPVPVADAILYGELDQASIERTVAQVTENPDQVKAVANQLVEMAARIRVRERKAGQERQAEGATSAVLVDKTLERKVAQQERALGFYQARTRELETLLRASEDQNRKSSQESKFAEAQLRQLQGYKDRFEAEVASGRTETAGALPRASTVSAESRQDGAIDPKRSPADRPKKISSVAGEVPGAEPKVGERVAGEAAADRTSDTKTRRPAAETGAVEPPSRESRAGAAAGVEGSLTSYKNKAAELEKKLHLAEERQKSLQSQLARFKQEKAQAKEGKRADGKPEAKGVSVEVLSSQLRELERRLRASEKEKQQLLDRAGHEARTVTAPGETPRAKDSVRVSGADPTDAGAERVTSSAESGFQEEGKSGSTLVKGDATRALQERVELLEVELRHLEAQKKQWLQQQKKEPQSTKVSGTGSGSVERPAPRTGSSAPAAGSESGRDTKAIDHYKEKIQELQATVSDLQRKYQEAIQSAKKGEISSRAPTAAPGASETPGPALDAGSPAAPDGEFDRQLESDSANLTQGVESITKKFESLKTDVKDDRVQARIDNVMQEVIAKRAELDALGKKLVGAIKRKELEFRQTEATLREEVRKTKEQVNQAQNSGERQKELLARFQKELEIARQQAAQATQDQSQYRMKAEQGQRQVDELQKEIERLARRAGPQKQNGALSPKESELLKQADTANKALIMKKQEVEVLKKQLQERAVQEAELKKAIFKLQNELRAAAKKAG